MTKTKQLSLIGILTALLGAVPVCADVIRIAVASNFADAIEEIVERFETQTKHRVIVAVGSTGKHYAQINHGAPFEAFFAADAARPKLLESNGIALPDSRFTYAIGKLVLWSPQPDMVDRHGRVLNTANFRHLAIANPKLAPYGRAAQEVMQNRGVWAPLQQRIVRGENINQTYQFVHSGNAELGFVALSHLQRSEPAREGSYWQPPQTLYRPIEQQAVLLNNTAAARAFLAFVKGPTARTIIQRHGYDTR